MLDTSIILQFVVGSFGIVSAVGTALAGWAKWTVSGLQRQISDLRVEVGTLRGELTARDRLLLPHAAWDAQAMSLLREHGINHVPAPPLLPDMH